MTTTRKKKRANSVNICLPRPHKGQRTIIRLKRRYNVIVCGRRFGKTVLGITLLITPELLKLPTAWFASSYKDMQVVYSTFKELLEPIIARASASDWVIELTTGGRIDFWTLENEDAGRSRAYARVIIDEAGLVRNLGGKWSKAIRATLADYEGDAFIMGTPKGMGDFFTLFSKEAADENGSWKSFQMPTSTNPHISKNEIEELRKELSERDFAQEVEAKFLEGSGSVFRRVKEANKSVETAFDKTHFYVISVDVGRVSDFTVVNVLDTNENSRQVAFDRFNQVDVFVQCDRICRMHEKYPNSIVVVESNGALALIDLLISKDIPIASWTTSNASKQKIIQQMERDFDYNDVELLDIPVQTDELIAFTSTVSQGGVIKYSAPPGMHDDCVMSLAIGRHYAREVNTGFFG